MTRSPIVAATLVAAAFSLLHLTLTPSLWPVDETAHVAYADSVVRGRLPVINDPIPPGLDVPGLDGRLAWERREHRGGRRDIWTANHPPLPHLLQGIALRTGGMLSPAAGLVAARLTSVLWLVLAVMLTMRLALRLTRDPRVAALAGLFLGLTPTLSHVSGLVFNDAAAIAMTTACLLTGVRVVQEGPSRRTLGLVIGVVGLAGLTRVSVLPAAGVAVALAAYALWRSERTSPRLAAGAAVLLGAAILPGAMFWARNHLLYGSLTAGPALMAKFGRDLNTPIPDLLQARWFWFRAWNRMWADLSTGHWAVWPRRGLSELVLVIVIGAATATAARSVLIRRSVPISPRPRADALAAVDRRTIWAGLLMVEAVVVSSTISFHSAGGSLHGRYLLGGHAITATLMAMAIVGAPRFGRALGTAAVLLLALLEAWLLRDLWQFGPAAWTRRGIPLELPMPLGGATGPLVFLLVALAAIALQRALRDWWVAPDAVPVATCDGSSQAGRRRGIGSLPSGPSRFPAGR